MSEYAVPSSQSGQSALRQLSALSFMKGARTKPITQWSNTVYRLLCSRLVWPLRLRVAAWSASPACVDNLNSSVSLTPNLETRNRTSNSDAPLPPRRRVHLAHVAVHDVLGRAHIREVFTSADLLRLSMLQPFRQSADQSLLFSHPRYRRESERLRLDAGYSATACTAHPA
jgi:hypothetical protein